MVKLLTLLLLTSCATQVITPSNSCPATEVVNKTDQPWTQNDQETLQSAKKRCPEIYENSPCLKYFAKVGFQNYHALCGR